MFTLKKKCSFILVLIKLVSDESDEIQRRCDQKCVLRAGENGRHRASPGDHVKKMSRVFLCVDQKGKLTSLDQRNLVCLNRINDN